MGPFSVSRNISKLIAQREPPLLGSGWWEGTPGPSLGVLSLSPESHKRPCLSGAFFTGGQLGAGGTMLLPHDSGTYSVSCPGSEDDMSVIAASA